LETPTSIGRFRAAPLLGALLALLLLGPSLGASAQADRRAEYLINLLDTSDNFRVRTQAVLSLGRLEPTSRVMRAVIEALSDDHPAVRTAAATSLQQLGDRSALPALRRQRQDSESSVRQAVDRAIAALERAPERTPPPDTRPPPDTTRPRGPVRYYVGVGNPGNSAEVSTAIVRDAREFLARELARMEGVEVAPSDESNAQAQRVISRRRVTGYYIDSSIVRVERQGGGTRAVVSIILNTYPGRDMRAILQGSATVTAGSGQEAQAQAVEAALQGALRRLPAAMAQSDPRARR